VTSTKTHVDAAETGRDNQTGRFATMRPFSGSCV
jgi:hypothetical protein